MVKLRIAARVIPEDVYLSSLESLSLNPRTLLREERRFPVIVHDPEEWYIGRLANEISAAYERLYKRPFGRVKYLKDDTDDCDLDPSLTVADLLLDEGRAARDGSDQHVTVKVIQEQGRALREGSVIPDLSASHYQVQPIAKRALPPVPRFDDIPSALGKRKNDQGHVSSRTNVSVNGTGLKRPRLDQIRELRGERADDDVISSIERDGVPESSAGAGVVIQNSQVKQESPELGEAYTNQENVEPATVDELEELPEAPIQFQRTPRQGLASTVARRSDSREIRGTSGVSHQQERSRSKSTMARDIIDRVARRQSNHFSSPANAIRNESATRTPGDAVLTLNRMSQSPAAASNSLQRAPMSTKKFLGNRRDVYEYPESDIDDTQMSPRSRASKANRFTPKLVSSAKKGNTSRVADDLANASVMDVTPAAAQQQHRRVSNSVAASTSRSKTSDSSATSASSRNQSKNQQNERSPGKSLAATVQSREETEEDLDSPSAQLQNESSNVKVSKRKDESAAKGPTGATVSDLDEDTLREPESVSDDEPSQKLETTKKHKARTSDATRNLSTNKSLPSDVRCYSCWVNTRTCDNARPKCGACTQKKCNCQMYEVTKDAYLEEKERRKANIEAQKKKADDEVQKRGRAARKAKSTSKAKAPSVVEKTGTDKGETPTNVVTAEKNGKKNAAPKSGAREPTQQTSEKKPVIATPLKDHAASSDSESESDEQDDEQDEIKKRDATTNNQTIATKAQTSAAQLNARNTSLNKQAQKSRSASGSESESGSKSSDSSTQSDEQPNAAKSSSVPVPSAPQQDPTTAPALSITSSQARILLPGMSNEEYDKLLASRAHLTDAQRQENKRMAKQRSTPDFRKSTSNASRESMVLPSSQLNPQSTSKAALAPPSSQTGSTTSKSKKPDKQIAGLATAPSLSKSASQAESARGHSHPAPSETPQPPTLTKKDNHPEIGNHIYPTPNTNTPHMNSTNPAATVLNSAASANNPPYRPQNPAAQKRVTPTTTPLTNTKSTTVNRAAIPTTSATKPQPPGSSTDPFANAVKPLASLKSLADLKRTLSARSTPSASAGVSTTNKTNLANAKKGFSLEDDDEESSDSSEDTDSESESDAGKGTRTFQSVSIAGNKGSLKASNTGGTNVSQDTAKKMNDAVSESASETETSSDDDDEE